MIEQENTTPNKEKPTIDSTEDAQNATKFFGNNKLVFLAAILLALGLVGMFVLKSFPQQEPIKTDTQPTEQSEKPLEDSGFSNLLEKPIDDSGSCNADLQKIETELEKQVVSVCEALAKHDSEALYMSLSPGIREIFPQDSFIETEQQSKKDMGEVINVTITKAVEIRTDGEFNGEFADAYFRIERTSQTNTYLTRFFLEDGSWWLLGTEDTDNF